MLVRASLAKTISNVGMASTSSARAATQRSRPLGGHYSTAESAFLPSPMNRPTRHYARCPHTRTLGEPWRPWRETQTANPDEPDARSAADRGQPSGLKNPRLATRRSRRKRTSTVLPPVLRRGCCHEAHERAKGSGQRYAVSTQSPTRGKRGRDMSFCEVSRVVILGPRRKQRALGSGSGITRAPAGSRTGSTRLSLRRRSTKAYPGWG